MSEFKKTWNESFKNYAIDIAKIYVHQPEHIINCLKFDSVCGSLNETYLALVSEKEIDPLEKLEQAEKLRIWETAKTLSDEKNKCVLISRAIYLLEKLTA
jgi:hypothetical protein